MQRLLRQLAQGLGVLWGSVTLVFLIFSQVPDPARAIAGQNERAEAIEAFRELHGLNLSLGERYVRFLGELSPEEHVQRESVVGGKERNHPEHGG